MQAIVLCGGKGTRLSALYADRPKILAPVAGRPFIEWQFDWLAHGGVTDIHLAGGHLADVLRCWMETRCLNLNTSQAIYSIRCSEIDLRVTLSKETYPLGTGGGLKFVEPFIKSDPFFVINGDSLIPSLNFGAMADQHVESGGGATLAVTRIEEAGRYGTVEFNESLRITAFREKASRVGGWVNGGVYLMARIILANIQPETTVSIETELFPALAEQGGLHAFITQPPLLDMGTPEGIGNMTTYMCGQ